MFSKNVLKALFLIALTLMPLPGFAQTLGEVSINRLLVTAPAEGQFEVGDKMSILLDIASSRQGPFLYIVQIKDPDGFTEYLEMQQIAFTGNHSIALPWVPQKVGMYIFQAFVWDSLSNPKSLSSSVGSLDVAGTTSFVAHCEGAAICLSGTVTKIIDGDTIRVNNIAIRLALVNTPERGEQGYKEAKDYTSALCPVGASALVDEDDGQTKGSYDRMVAKVFCSNKLLNAELLYAKHAVILTTFCDVSEFASEAWAQQYGC